MNHVKALYSILIISMLLILPSKLAQAGEYALLFSTQDVDEFRKLFADLNQKAKSGNSEAQNLLGVMFSRGLRVKKDNKSAFKLFQMAARQGFTVAQYNQGRMFEDGKGTKSDPVKAFELYKTAGNKGHLEAQYQVGKLWQFGYGTPSRNLENASKWYRMAAQRGHVDAQYSLSKTDMSGQAGKWLRVAANNGHTQARYNLKYRNDTDRQDRLGKRIEAQKEAADFLQAITGIVSLAKIIIENMPEQHGVAVENKGFGFKPMEIELDVATAWVE